MTPSDILNALTHRDWYAVAAVTLMVATQIARKNAPVLWSKIPKGFRFLWPTLAAMAAAFVHAFLTKAPLSLALGDTFKIAFLAMGGAAALKESPVPWDGGPGGVPASPAPAPSPSPALADATEDESPTPVDRGSGAPPASPPTA